MSTNFSTKKGSKMNLGLVIVVVVLIAVIITLCIFLFAGNNDEPNDTNPTSAPTDVIDNKTDEPSGDPTEAPATATAKPSYNLVSYSGKVEHVFTHSILAFPELAYGNKSKETYYENYGFINDSFWVDFITVDEFKKVLETLYADGYMLVNLNDCYEKVDNGDGTYSFKMKSSFMFPEGKKPLVFSFDDTNYYKSNKGHGVVDKLILKDGKVQTYTKMKDGSEIISDDNEYIPIIDNFVESHPDFSYNGAKGMICLTGYEGILGYRTQRISESGLTVEQRQAEVDAVLPIVAKLKETGWYFASHSYKHGSMASHESPSWILDDVTKFENEVTPLIGKTTIWVYPYGSWCNPKYYTGETTESGIPKAQLVLNEHGYEFFCSVGANYYVATRADLGGVILQDRLNIDGTTLMKNESVIKVVDGTNKPRFPSFNAKDIFSETDRCITYDEAVLLFKTKKGLL